MKTDHSRSLGLGGSGQTVSCVAASPAAVLPFTSSRHERILVLNAGSSTFKWSYFDTRDETGNAGGRIEREIRGGRAGHSIPVEQAARPGKGEMTAFVARLRDPAGGLGRKLDEVTLIAHRVVHGGTAFVAPVMLCGNVLAELDRLVSLAPLHMPLCLEGIREMLSAFPSLPQVAVFDTAFHAAMPLHSRIYGLPFSYYEKLGIRRFGFHGLSHAYAARAAAFFLGKSPNEVNSVSCHLGGGASVCAVHRGRSMDTTMGFTPAEGLLMGTRCGDIDPAVLCYLAREYGYTLEKAERMLNEESGLLGISGISADFREVEDAAGKGHRRARLALCTFAYRVRKAVGSAVAALGGADAVVFTGGIGQNSPAMRAAALQGLDCMGIHLDPALNQACKGGAIERISGEGQEVVVIVIPCQEERMIAVEALGEIEGEYLPETRRTWANEPVPIETSAHHVHLSQQHVTELFGPHCRLMKASELSQPGQYACSQRVSVVGPAGTIEGVRVLGPARKETQVEVSKSDQFRLGLQAPIRESGDLAGSAACVLEGPAGRVALHQGVICAMRHIHMSPEDALRFGVRDGSVVRVRIGGDREMVYGDVRIRVHPDFRLAMHLDTDEANAGNLQPGSFGFIVEIQEPDERRAIQNIYPSSCSR